MADEMKGNGIGEQLAAFEERLNLRFDAIDGRFDAIDTRFDAVDRRFDAVDTRFDAIDGRFDSVDRRGDGADARMDSLEHALQVQFEETHRLIRLSLEGQAILKESMERRFDEADRKLDEQTELLKHAQRHTAERVGRLERRR